MATTSPPGRRKRRGWLIALLAAVLLAGAAIGLGYVRSHFSKTPQVQATTGPIGPSGGRATSFDRRTTLTVPSGVISSPVTVTFLPTDAHPAVSPVDKLVQPVGDPVTLKASGVIRKAEIAIAVSPSQLPRPDASRPQATMQNLGIQVYTADLGLWLPLASTVDSEGGLVKANIADLSLSTFRVVAAKLGAYTLAAGRTIKVNFDASATPDQIPPVVAAGAVKAVLLAATQPLGAEKYKCQSPSRNFDVKIVSSHADAIAACVVNAEGHTQLRIKSQLRVPLRLDYPTVNDVGIALGGSSDFPELAGQLASLLQSRPLAYGPGVAAVGIGETPPYPAFAVRAKLSWAPLSADLAGTLLSAWLPEGKNAGWRQGLAQARQEANAKLVRNRNEAVGAAALRSNLGQSMLVERQARGALAAIECASGAGAQIQAANWPQILQQIVPAAGKCLESLRVTGLNQVVDESLKLDELTTLGSTTPPELFRSDADVAVFTIRHF